jgi:hypothetical protein
MAKEQAYLGAAFSFSISRRVTRGQEQEQKRLAEIKTKMKCQTDMMFKHGFGGFHLGDDLFPMSPDGF